MIRDQRGFTLAEILVAAAVLSMMMAALLIVQQQGQFAYITGAARVETQQNARWALDALTGELRSALEIKDDVVGCLAGGASSITFNIKKPPPDDTLPPPNDRVPVKYELASPNLVRTYNNDNTTTTTITTGVEAFRLSLCRDKIGAPTETAALVQSLHIRIQTRSEYATAGAGPQNQRAVLEAHLSLRNLL